MIKEQKQEEGLSKSTCRIPITSSLQDFEPCQNYESCQSIQMLLERVSYLEQLVRKYKFDALTGLMTKQDFNEEFDRMFEEYLFMDSNFYLAIIDINELHNINREKGYLEGDKLIKKVADALRDLFPIHNIFRISGDEFVVIIRESAIKEKELKERLKKIPNSTFAYSKSNDYQNPSQMFKDVDKKLSKIKSKSKRI